CRHGSERTWRRHSVLGGRIPDGEPGRFPHRTYVRYTVPMPDLTFQGSLFSGVADAGPFDPDFSGIERIELDRGAWIERQPGWATDPDRLFMTARAALVGREGPEPTPVGEVPRPRLVASFDRPDLPAGLEVFRAMSSALSERYGVDLV